MRFGYSCDDVLVLPQDLQDFAWSAPMRDLAAMVGLSDVGLKKLLKSYGVVTPPQGYWNKLHAGKPLPKCPNAPTRRAGCAGRLRLDSRFKNVLSAVEPLPSSGPFASATVPEDLGELFQQELKAIGRVAVPRKLERVHCGLTQIFKKEQHRREKFALERWKWDEPKFDSAVDQRRLKLFNAVFMTLSRCGHGASAYERDGQIDATALVGDMRLGLEIVVASKHRTVRLYGRDRPAPDLPVSIPLAFLVDGERDCPGELSWQDDATGKLETKIAEIVARIIVAGEAKLRRSLREAEERAEEHRRWQEKRRQEAIEARNRERLQHLRESGDLLRQAEDLRALISRVRSAVTKGLVNVEETALEEWEQWASAEADLLDPVLSGQISTSLGPWEDHGREKSG